jgi:hypothetical protein
LICKPRAELDLDQDPMFYQDPVPVTIPSSIMYIVYTCIFMANIVCLHKIIIEFKNFYYKNSLERNDIIKILLLIFEFSIFNTLIYFVLFNNTILISTVSKLFYDNPFNTIIVISTTLIVIHMLVQKVFNYMSKLILDQ